MDWRKLFRSPKPDPYAALSQRLRCALVPLMGQHPPEFVASFLRTVRADTLVNIDQRLRTYWSKAYEGWSADTLHHIVSCPMPEDERQSLLFIASSHHDGRERQKAVWSFGQFPGFLALSAALIRSSDWVPQVQFAARNSVGQLLRECNVEDVVAALPVVLRLQERERSADGWLAETLEGWMLDPANGGLLRRARASSDPGVRVWAYRRSIQCGEVALAQALMQPDPRIGLYALSHAREGLHAASVAALANYGLDAPHPVIRRECLRALASSDEVAATAALPRALLDRSSGVRRLAAFLTRQTGVDPRLVWRNAIDHSAMPVPVGALASLAEEAQMEDVARFRGLLFAHSSVIRQQALKGLVRIDQSISPEELGRLLQLGGSRVMTALLTAVHDSAVSLDAHSLLHVLAFQGIDQTGRDNLRHLLNGGGLWDSLKELLELRVRDTDRQWWLATVDDWIGRSGAYAPLGGVRKQALLEATRRRSADLDRWRVDKIEAALLRY